MGRPIQTKNFQKTNAWQTAKDAVDFLWDPFSRQLQVNIGFYGGEPLLEFRL